MSPDTAFHQPHVTIVSIRCGTIEPLAGDGRPSAIVKTPIAGPVFFGQEGLDGDHQADRRVHGGPDKAVHFYPACHYFRLAAHFGDIAERLVPGVLGENLSALAEDSFDEHHVCLGDYFQLGAVVLQISQPRTPCWKIDTRLAASGVAAYIAAHGYCGWYFRVLEPGLANPGDKLMLIERDPSSPTLARFGALWREHRPAPGVLRGLARAPGLPEPWRERLKKRADWLEGLSTARPDTDTASWHADR